MYIYFLPLCISTVKASLFICSPYGMIQCDMQLNKNIYFFVNKRKRDVQA